MSIRREGGVTLLFSLTLLCSAFLLFSLQPLVGRMLLPTLGGAPAVWNGCMFFFQALLFGGYLYAHFLLHAKGKRALFLQLFLFCGALFFLPVSFGEIEAPQTGDSPLFWLLEALFYRVAVPFFALSSLAPLLQGWFSRLPHKDSENPYFLYAASNGGSFLALLLYPFVIEPLYALQEQASSWRYLFVILCFFLGSCALLFYRRGLEIHDVEGDSELLSKLSVKQCLYWIFLAFVPSSYMLGVTGYLTTDVAPVPLLWVVPLMLYLLTFVIAFAKGGKGYMRYAAILLPIFLMATFGLFSFKQTQFFLAPLHLATFFCAALVAHTQLFLSRPSARKLSLFYLFVSFGGMCGGVFNALLAPVIFTGLTEYPLILLLCVFLYPVRVVFGEKRAIFRDFLYPFFLFAVIRLVLTILDRSDLLSVMNVSIFFILLSVPVFLFYARPLRFVLALLVICYTGSSLAKTGEPIFADRSFFGTVRVLSGESTTIGRYHQLAYGNIRHGLQGQEEKWLTEPLSYYHREGVMARFFETYKSESVSWRIGVVGLGTGAVACYGSPEQSWRFYEIDPIVVELAQNNAYFSYLESCTPQADIVLGDARLSLMAEPEGAFDLLQIDAFNSDFIPMHLLTSEALSLYMSRLKVGGILLFHISNRYLNLEPVLANLAEKLGYAALRLETPSDPTDSLLKSRTVWIAFSAEKSRLTPLLEQDFARIAEADHNVAVWTDDFANIIELFSF